MDVSDSVRNGGWAAWCHYAMFVLDPGHAALAAKSTPVVCLSVCLSVKLVQTRPLLPPDLVPVRLWTETEVMNGKPSLVNSFALPRKQNELPSGHQAERPEPRVTDRTIPIWAFDGP